MRSPLLTLSGAFSRSAIMARAWIVARANVAGCERARRMFPEIKEIPLRCAFGQGLKEAWAEAKSARSYEVWRLKQDRARERRKTLDARTREIEELHLARAAAEGIDSTPAYLLTVRQIEERLSVLGAR